MKIAFLINAIANYGRLLSVLRACCDEGHDVSVICGGSAVLSRFAQHGNTVADTIENDFLGQDLHLVRVRHMVEEASGESAGMAAVALSPVLEQLDPDFVIVIGDRFETLGGVLAAYYQNRCIIHFQGGELSGTLDEGARHAITKLSHYHVPATEDARQRLLAMGEHLDTILAVGCPGIDLLKIQGKPVCDLLVAFHPNTCDDTEQVGPLLAALDCLQWDTVFTWPNADDGSQQIMKDIRIWREQMDRPWLTMRRYMHPEGWAQAIATCRVCVGNSSAFVREAVADGTPVVLLGNRQRDRVFAKNVLHCQLDAHQIAQAIQHAQHFTTIPDERYGDGHTADRFVAALKQVRPYTQKRWHETLHTNAARDTQAGQGTEDSRSRLSQAIQ